MTGKYEIEIYNNRVHYFLQIKRNITLLQGNSATGKTELIRLISDFEANGKSSGITVRCDVPCTVLTPVDWEQRLGNLKGKIIFIDETAGFLRTQRFAERVRGSDNYFVIITRDDLPQMPYSVEEIYGLRNDRSKYKPFRKVYNEMYRLYHFTQEFAPDIVITEDSNAGFQCFELIYGGICKSAGGKSRIYDLIRNHKDGMILVIVDGAAFGSEMGKIDRYLKTSEKKCTIFAPESFEYLILKSGILELPSTVTEETYLHADSIKYMSWEEFYTDYLVQNTQRTVYQYNKSVLAESYKTEGSLRRIVAVLPEQIRGKRNEE